MTYINSTNNLNVNSPVHSTAISYAAALSDYIIEVSDTSASRTITLPTAAAANTGKIYIIKDSSGAAFTNGFPIIIQPSSGTIDGASDFQIVYNYGSVQVYSDGSDWYTDTGETSATLPFSWVAKAAGAALVPNFGYYSTSGSSQSFPLPSSAAAGSVIALTQVGAGIVTITQAAGQSIVFGNSTTTVGAGGSIVATAAGDTVQLLCTTANTTFQVLSSIGNWTIV